MANLVKVIPRENGILTVRHYMSQVNANMQSGLITRPDLSRIRLEPSTEELKAYERIIRAQLKSSGATTVNAQILFQASRKLADRIGDLGTSDYIFGLRPGSDDPIHYGHVSAGLAAMIYMNSIGISLNGAIFATGGKVPDKPEISAFAHREAMAKLMIKPFMPWIAPTSIRNLTAEQLGERYIYVNGKRSFLMGATAEARRAFCDIAAFDWLFAMNPNMRWYYITGSDKVNGYGKKDEEQLVYHTHFKNKVKVLYFERDDEPVDPKFIAMRPWLQEVWNAGMFIRSEVSSYSGLSATKLRKMIIDGDGNAVNEVYPGVIDYASQNGIINLYKLNDAVKQGTISRDSQEYKDQLAFMRAIGIID